MCRNILFDNVSPGGDTMGKGIAYHIWYTVMSVYRISSFALGEHAISTVCCRALCSSWYDLWPRNRMRHLVCKDGNVSAELVYVHILWLC